MTSILSEYARLIRLPGLGGLSVSPVFGAITVGMLSLFDLSLLFLIGVFSAVYGFVLNDLVDIDVDRLSKELSDRPLVSGTISRKAALLTCFLCVVGTFTIIFIFFYKPHVHFYLALLCIVLAAFFGTLYNVFGKKFVGSDVLVALSEALLVLFGTFVVLKDNGSPNMFTWIVFILTFNQLLYMNAVEGGLKDADHDYLMGVKNIALASGVKVSADKKITVPLSFKAFGLLIRFFSAYLIFIPVLFYGTEYYEIWNIFLLLLLVIGVLYLSIKLLCIKKFDRKRIRRLISLQTFLRYSAVPTMLIPVIGLLYAFILIILHLHGTLC